MRVKCLFSFGRKKDSWDFPLNAKASKFKKILDAIVLVLFGLSFFSIPTLSFIPGLNLITWLFTILLFLVIFIDLLIFGQFKFNVISISYLLFCFSAFLSSLLNGMINFTFTPLFLSITSLVILTFILDNKLLKNYMMTAAYFGVVGFLFVYIIQYRNELLSMNFDRLGGFFGDENDVAIFMAFGFTYSLYMTLFNRKVLIKFICVLLTLLFAFCGISCGSKIVLLVYLVVICTMIFMLFGRKKIWLSFLVIGGIVIVGIIAINLPFMETIRTRLLEFIATTFGIRIPGIVHDDYSTIYRFEMFINGLGMFLQKPLFGWGIWGFANFGGFNGGWSHNHISETLCNFGLVGTLLFHMGFILCFKDLNKKHRFDKRTLIYAIFFIAIMVSVALNSQKIYAYFSPLLFSDIDTQYFGKVKFLSHKIYKITEEA